MRNDSPSPRLAGAFSLAGIVLCGGRSTRMGRPKAWLPFGNETLLERMVRTVGEAVDRVVVVAAPNQALPPLPEAVRIVRDPVEGQGPLQGIAAGLDALQGHAETAFITSCDAPFLNSALIHCLFDTLGSAQAAVPHLDGRFYPTTAVYRVSLVTEVRKLLASGRFRASLLCESVSTRPITESELTVVDPELRSLWNINTPEEYAAALRLLANARE